MRIELFDILRWIALLAMIFFHGNYMALHLFWIDVDLFSYNTWQKIGFAIWVSFITLSGYVNAYGYNKRSFRENMKRGLKRAWYLALFASLISLVTSTFFYEQRISWGIIHFFALASLLQSLFSKFSWWIFPSIVASFLLSNFISGITVDTPYLVPLGLSPSGYYSADYYPLFPWFWYVLMGQWIGLLLSKSWIEQVLARMKFPRFALFLFLGKHSLIIYIIHTPVLYVLFSFILFVLSLS